VCYGDGKSVVTEAWCARRGIDLAKCYFYTDSMSDVSLLEKVGHPVAVNPDRRLRAHAKKRGWAVMDWGVAKPKDPMKKPRYSYGCLAFHGAKSGPG
jgi:phosphoserine phosphatase